MTENKTEVEDKKIALKATFSRKSSLVGYTWIYLQLRYSWFSSYFHQTISLALLLPRIYNDMNNEFIALQRSFWSCIVSMDQSLLVLIHRISYFYSNFPIKFFNHLSLYDIYYWVILIEYTDEVWLSKSGTPCISTYPRLGTYVYQYVHKYTYNIYI